MPFLFDGPSEVFWFDFAIGTILGLVFSVIALVLYLPAFSLSVKALSGVHDEKTRSGP